MTKRYSGLLPATLRSRLKAKARLAMTDMDSFRHCERSEAIQGCEGLPRAVQYFRFSLK